MYYFVSLPKFILIGMESTILQHSEARSIGDILSSPSCFGSSQTLRQCRALSLWTEASNGIAEKYTRSVNWHDKILYVELTSAAVRSELYIQRTQIMERINKMAGEAVVTKIVLK